MSGLPSMAPAWWRELQDEFGAFLRSPLQITGGRFRSGAASSALLTRCVDDGPGAAARLALHHEQYWMRLFQTLQQAFPRTARVTGCFVFNQLAMAHLQACPPRGRDLADVGRGFFPALQHALDGLLAPGARARARNGVIDAPLALLPTLPIDNDPAARALQATLRTLQVPWSMLAQAVALDEACRRAFEVPAEPPWTMTDDALAALRASHVLVRTAASLSLVRLDWAVDDELALTQAPPENSLANAAGADAVTDEATPLSTTRLAAPRHHVLVTRVDGVAHATVDPVFARLLVRMRRETLEAAVRHIAEKFPPQALAHLHASMDRFAVAAAAQGWWVGVTPAPATMTG